MFARFLLIIIVSEDFNKSKRGLYLNMLRVVCAEELVEPLCWLLVYKFVLIIISLGWVRHSNLHCSQPPLHSVVVHGSTKS